MACLCGQHLNAQETNLDWKLIDIGNLRQTVTNMATFGSGWTYCAYEFPFTSHIDFSLIRDHYHPGWSEYPKGSSCSYGDWAPWIGGIRAGQKLVSTGGPEHLTGTVFNLMYEFYPTAEASDSVWAVPRGKTVDIPYWQNYTAISDLDVICKFNDYTIKNILDHNPLYVDVIQVTYAWASMDFLVHQYWIIPTVDNLSDVYFCFAGEASIGCSDAAHLDQQVTDEYGWFDEERKLGIEMDLPGSGDDKCVSGPIGFRIIPDLPEDQLTWTWYDGQRGQEYPNIDQARYDLLTSGITHDELQDHGSGTFQYAVGPFQLPLGDTLHITVGQIYSDDLDNLYDNLDRLLWLKGKKYRLPGPPPAPPLRVETANHQATLRWDALAGDVNPEMYEDQYRGDGVLRSFEGYRVYKSTQSIDGPWTLLAEYDIAGNNIGANTGIQYSYTDIGLLNNLEYYYSVTAFARPDSVLALYNLESSLTTTAQITIPGTASPETVGKVAVVPNPYRGDQKYYQYKPPWEKVGRSGTWTEETRRIQFINLPQNCEIKIYSVSGKYVNTIVHNDPNRGFEDWNLTSFVGQSISSGIYLFTVQDLNNEQVQVGKFVIIK